MDDGAASFGYWIRRRRKALDLTQADVARAVPCAVITVKKIEADERRPSRQVAERLADILRIGASQRALFLDCASGTVTALRLPSPVLLAQARPPFRPLPAPATSFVGRSAEAARLCQRLRSSDVRLVTVTGSGGVGKTRLALQCARLLEAEFDGNVCFIDLTAARDAEAVPAVMAAALGIREPAKGSLTNELQSLLRDRSALLVLDNAEHVLDALPLVSAVLSLAPRLKVLATSRAALRLAGEHVFRIGGLDDDAAVTLFAERALAAGGPAVDERIVAAICRRLDGVPLAIELAASQTRFQSLDALLAKLEHRFATLVDGPRDVPARHQSLRQALDWSYDLLDDAGRRCFERLGVFVGGWTLPAALAVCGPDAERQVAVLLDCSLIQPAVDARPGRFSMLDTVRDYALDRLPADEADQARRRLLVHLAATIAQARERVFIGGDSAPTADVRAEFGNVRDVLVWATDGRAVAEGASLAAAAAMFWFECGLLSEGRTWLQRTALLYTRPDAVRAQLLFGLGLFAWQQGDFAAARAALGESTAICLALGEPAARGLADATHLLGHVEFDQRNAEASALHKLGHIALRRGDHDTARARFATSLALQEGHGNRQGIVECLAGFASLAMACGHAGRAARLFGCAAVLLSELGAPLAPADQCEWDRDCAAARGQLGAVTFGSAWAAGREMRLADAIALARSDNSD